MADDSSDRFDERTARRHSLRVDCQVYRDRDLLPLCGEVVDISLSGIQLRAEELPGLGDRVWINFRPPRTDRTLRVEGVVTRVTAGRRRNERGETVGIEFKELTPEAHAGLCVMLRRLPPTVPQRKSRLDYADAVRRVTEVPEPGSYYLDQASLDELEAGS